MRLSKDRVEVRLNQVVLNKGGIGWYIRTPTPKEAYQNLGKKGLSLCTEKLVHPGDSNVSCFQVKPLFYFLFSSIMPSNLSFLKSPGEF